MIVPSAIGSLFGLAMIVTFSQVDSAWLKWLDYYVRAHSLAYILAKRELTPSDEEMKSATVFVWRKVLHIK